MNLKLKFEVKDLNIVLVDRLIIETDDYAYEFGIRASPSKPQLFYNYTSNLGFVSLGTTKKEKINFINKGTREAIVSVRPTLNNIDIDIDPHEFKVLPDERKDIYVISKGIKIGQSREIYKVIVNDEEQERSIDILSTVIEHSIALVSVLNNKPLQLINFENLFYGDKRSIST